MHDHDAVVVGGGLTGLMAALRLQPDVIVATNVDSARLLRRRPVRRCRAAHASHEQVRRCGIAVRSEWHFLDLLIEEAGSAVLADLHRRDGG
jgi:succinate dehydrogenase/fumarate reductase flavoprotein subunit